MRAIMIMFDTLSRRALPNYGAEDVIAPNFQRLKNAALRSITFMAEACPACPRAACIPGN